MAVLTKGPVGVALPGLVFLLYFAWNRELRRLLDHKILWALLTFLLVAGPWYGLVTAETRGEWARAFFGRENLQRFSTPMENHRGPIFYHAVALLALFMPWSVFLIEAVWRGVKACRREEPNPPAPFPKREGGEDTSAGSPPSLLGKGAGGLGSSHSHRAFRFLICWFGAYLVFFSAAATKLPNYVLPLYPAIAILTARLLTRWQGGELALPKRAVWGAIAGLALIAAAVGVGFLVAGDAVKVLPPGSRVFPGLERWAFIGLIPLGAAAVMARALRANDRPRFVRAMTVGAVAFTAAVAAFPSLAIDARKAPKELVRASGVDDPSRELRLAHCQWFQPSLVFYARREIVEVMSAEQVANFFAVPTPGYLFVPAPIWESVEPKVAVPTRVVARRYDFVRNREILVVTNDVTVTAGR
jgi:4-amino-4-deoxy-L-arabinose transferase-like glycosyltransferase